MGKDFVFKRNIQDNDLINKLKDEELYSKKILLDLMNIKKIQELQEKIKKNKKDKEARREFLSIKRNFVYPAIRKDGIYFYYYNSLLFKYTNEDEFYTHPKFAFIPKEYAIDYVTDKIYPEEVTNKNDTEDETVENVNKVADFIEGYQYIKERAKLYTSVEAAGVYNICRNGNFFTNDKYIVLDIEIAFKKVKEKEDEVPVGTLQQKEEMEEEKRGRKQDRIDLLLYDIENSELQFVEAKDYSNKEIAPKEKPTVVNQIKRYNKILEKPENRQIILDEYKKYVQNINKMFKDELPKPLPIPKKLSPKCGLVIFGFDGDQKNGRLKKIEEKLKNHKVKIYCNGNANNIDIKTLYTQIRNKIKD